MLADLDSPIARADATRARADVPPVLAVGTQALGDLVADSSADAFDSADELASEVMSRLPRRAVGEPYQSKGEG